VGPHDTAGSAPDVLEVQRIEGTLSIIDTVEVDVSVSKGTTGGSITADTDGGNRANGVEDLE